MTVCGQERIARVLERRFSGADCEKGKKVENYRGIRIMASKFMH